MPFRRGWLIGIGVVLVALVLALINGIVLGPMRNLISTALAETGTLSDSTVQNSKDVVEKVAGEGIILTKNTGLPLTGVTNLNVFGWVSTNPVYGGTGSGAVDAYTDSIMSNARSFSDTALIVIARCGGEGADLPHDMGAVMDGSYQKGTKYTRASYTNNDDYDDFGPGSTYLELGQTEKNLVELVCSSFDNVVVVHNGSNPLEMGWTEEYGQIKGVLLCASPGATSFNALGKILTGEINPSGKTVDTWLRDVTQSPTYNNIGHFSYSNVEDVISAAQAAWERADGVVSFINYVEGIYVGYRYFETAYVEAQENGCDFDYDSVVMYPFGYGLSYTSFTQTLGAPTITDTNGTYDPYQYNNDSDGPAGVNYSLTGAFGMGYCGEILLAQTWNTELAYEMTDGICQKFVDFGFNGWYAPSMNLHRSPFAGRNFEYDSEDSLLSAKMAVE